MGGSIRVVQTGPEHASQPLGLRPVHFFNRRRKDNRDFWTQCKHCVSSCRRCRMVTKATSAGCLSPNPQQSSTSSSTNLDLSRTWTNACGVGGNNGKNCSPLRPSGVSSGEQTGRRGRETLLCPVTGPFILQSYKQVCRMWQGSSPSL